MKRIVLALCVTALAAAALTACGTTTSTTTPVQTKSAGATPAAVKATVGDTLNITGNGSDKLAVTLVGTKRLPEVKAYGTVMHPALYGVNLTVKNLGTAVYDDSITNCVTVVDAKDQSHSAEIAVSGSSGATLTGLLDSVKIAPGDRRSGWVFVDMPKKTPARTLQFTADSGMGPQVGEWTLH